MLNHVVPPPFGRDRAEDENFSGSFELAGRQRGPRRWPRAGLLCLVFACVPLASFGSSAELSGLSCSARTFSGAAATTCTVTMSRKTSGIRKVTLSSSSTSVQVPSAMYVWTRDTSDPFTATVSAVSSPQTVTLTATSSGISETYTLLLLSLIHIRCV